MSRRADPQRALEPYDGLWTGGHAAHLLRRALGGGSREEIAEFAALTPEQAVDALFVAADPRVGSAWAGVGATLARTGDRQQLAAWWLMKLIRDRRAMGSRWALFLHDHFACTMSKTQDLVALYDQHQLFVERGGGPFDQLLVEVVAGPAMLRFLDGDRNRRGAPNENLAREVLELFTLGVGHYTEQDVKEAARALTGWTIRSGSFAHVAAHHDPRPKTVLGQDVDDGHDLCRLAAGHPRCARFLVEKVWCAYVSSAPDDHVLDVLAGQWRASGMRLDDLLRTVLRSRAFHDAASHRALVKSPVELVAGALRATRGRPDLVAAARACEGMGQRLFEPPGVQGWAGGESWIHAAAWIARTDFAAQLAASLDDETLDVLFAPGDGESGGGLFARLTDSGDARADVVRSLELLGLGDLPEPRQAALRGAVPRGTPAADRRRDLLHAALCLPEAHLS